MERCSTCHLQNKHDNKYNHDLINTNFAAESQHYCQQRKKVINLTDKRSHLQTNAKKK